MAQQNFVSKCESSKAVSFLNRIHNYHGQIYYYMLVKIFFISRPLYTIQYLKALHVCMVY